MKRKDQGGRIPLHDNSFKMAVAREYLTGSMGRTEIGRKYNLTANQVGNFVNWYRKRYGNDIAEDKGDVGQDATVQSNTEKDLQKRLDAANLKVEALERLIEVARKELGIDILKKGGTKQS